MINLIKIIFVINLIIIALNFYLKIQYENLDKNKQTKEIKVLIYSILILNLIILFLIIVWYNLILL